MPHKNLDWLHWVGIAMAFVAMAAGAVLGLYPDYRMLLWAVVLVSAAGAAYSVRRALMARRAAAVADAESASNGIKWVKVSSGFMDDKASHAMNGVVMDTRRVIRSITVGNISHDGSGVLLPQPLTFKLLCSDRIREAFGFFYSDIKDLNTRKDDVKVEVVPTGREVTITLRDRKLVGTAAIAVTLMSMSKKEITVEVSRQVI